MGFLSYGFTTSIQVDSVRCNGGNDGKIVVTVNGGTPPFIFTWSTGQKDTTNIPADSLMNLTAGNYWVVIDDAGSSDFHSIEVYEPDAINIDSETTTDVSCNGGNDGTITITASGGIPPYAFSIDGGSTFYGNNGSFAGLSAGIYPVVVRDDNGCTQAGSLLAVNEPPVVTVQTDSVREVSCKGDTDGAIAVSVNGGTPPYHYSWSGPNGYSSTNEDLSGLEAGNYILTVTDANNCSFTNGAIPVYEPAVLTVSLDNQQNVTCHGADNGLINVTVAGGTQPYTFLWNGPGGYSSTNEDITNLTPGNYSLTVTDAHGCSASLGPVTITEPPALGVTVDAITDVTCFGDSSGAIQVTVTGGTPPYGYSWSGPGGYHSTLEDVSGLSAGSYILTITDANACAYVPDTMTVDQPAVISISAVTTDVTCYGADDGTLTITATGGTPPFVFSIDGGTTYLNNGGSFTGLTPGNYTLAVRDANGCMQTGNTVAISEPSQIVIQSETKTDVTCHGASDGSITITGGGGTPPYTYSLDGGTTWQDNGGSFPGLGPGTYDLAIKDSHGCEQTGSSLTVNEPDALIFTLQSGTGITCHGGDDGTITLHAGGGTPPYAFSIDGGITFLSNGGSFTGLHAGNYPTAVQDANGCITNGVILTLSEPQVLVINGISHTDVTCHGGSNGSITMHASGGTSPYVFSADGGSSFADNGGSFTGLSSGIWPLAVRDVNGCVMFGDTVIITEPPALTIGSVNKTDISCHGLTDGKIDLSAAGGTAPLQYSIDGGMTFSDTHLFENLSAGDYDLAVRDANGCLFYGNTVTISDPPQLTINTVNITDVLCNGDNSGELRILASGGTGSYLYSINNGQAFYDNNGLFLQLTAGTYTPAVRDTNGCTTVAAPAIVNEPPPIQVTIDTVRPTCSKFSFDGEISVLASGGTGNFVYSIDNGTSFVSGGTFTGLEGGLYHILVKDANACTTSSTVQLQGKYTVIANAGNDTAVCPGTTVQLHGSGGETYQWEPAHLLDDPAVANPLASPPATTDFILTVSSAICYNKDTVTVTIYPVHGLDAGRDTVILEGSDITLTAVGEGFSQYHWYPPDGLDATTGQSVMVTPEREMTYFVEATTTEGCLEKDSIHIGLIRELSIPSGFTPNGDGKNDTWHFGHTEYYPDMTVEVFDRWGHRVFYSKGYDSAKEWDGTYHGKNLATGTYYFVINLHDVKHTPPITGPVTIIR
ncbi:MAG: gliding motility-associated C-terminal domain-containing protein [Bacteroidales bacterium]|nr:gliding motility-associated C-terminal domain-containing protein [Bacteroidales bacterium]